LVLIFLLFLGCRRSVSGDDEGSAEEMPRDTLHQLVKTGVRWRSIACEERTICDPHVEIQLALLEMDTVDRAGISHLS
jgi:hypothetical protein